MAATFKWLSQKNLDNLPGHLKINESRRQAKDIRVIVRPRQARDFNRETDDGADPRKSVRRNGHTCTGAAAEDSTVGPILCDHTGAKIAGIRIVRGLGGMAPNISDRVARLDNLLLQLLLQSETGVVRRHGDLQGIVSIAECEALNAGTTVHSTQPLV